MIGADGGWDWEKLSGDPVELKWNRKDLTNLAAVLDHVECRRVAIQAGGCLGIFPKALAAAFERVYTFEPSPVLFPDLVRNAPEQNIVRFQAALGAGQGMVDAVCKLRDNDGKTVLHQGMTHVTHNSNGLIPTMRIDDLGIPVCDLIYLDIEGCELFALQGAEQLIMRCRPAIALEVNRGARYFGYGRDDVVVFLRMLGYDWKATYRSDELFLPSWPKK